MATELTESQFQGEVIESGDPVLVDFFATWCNPCKMMAPILDEVASRVEPRAHVYKIDIDQCHQLASKYEVMSVPTLMIFKDGQIVQKFIGVQSKEVLVNAIENALNK